VAIGSEATTSSHIEEMIQELTQTEGLEVSATETLREGTTIVTGEPTSQSGLPEHLTSLDPQLGKRTKMYHILLFLLLLLTLMFMVLESTWLAQVEDPIESISAEDSVV